MALELCSQSRQMSWRIAHCCTAPGTWSYEYGSGAFLRDVCGRQNIDLFVRTGSVFLHTLKMYTAAFCLLRASERNDGEAEADGEKEWEGKIYDPESDTEYRLVMWIEEDPNVLYVRGKHWTGLYRTQTWKRKG